MSVKNLLKKIAHQLKGAANDSYDKHQNPIRTLNQAKRDIDTEIEKLTYRHIETGKKSKSMSRSLDDLRSQMGQKKHAARKAKTNGETETAEREAARYLKLEKFLAQYEGSMSKLDNHKKAIESVIGELKDKKEDLQLEIDILDTKKDMAELSIYRSENIDGVTSNPTAINELIKSARAKIDGLEDEAEAYQETNDALNPKTEKSSSNPSDEVADFLKNL